VQYLTQRNNDQVEAHGPAFEEEFTLFVRQYGEDKIASAFVKEGQVFFPTPDPPAFRFVLLTSHLQQALLAKYKKEAPVIKREEEVRQAIASIKSSSHNHFLSMVRSDRTQPRFQTVCLHVALTRVSLSCRQALTQRNAEAVMERGPKLKELFGDFMTHYANDASAQSFIRETKARPLLL
jgi:hypothetical protein